MNHATSESSSYIDRILNSMELTPENRLKFDDMLAELATIAKLEAYRALCGCPDCQTA